MTKKILSVIIVASMALSLYGCSKNTEQKTSSNSSIDSVESVDVNESNETREPSGSSEASGSVGIDSIDFSFASSDILGNDISSDIFAERELTLINIFATWCPPCVEEIPFLSQLNNDYKDQGFGIIGFVTDTKNPESGEIDEAALEAANTLYSENNVSYPFVIPDDTFLNGLLFVQYYPTSVFVDRNGNIVGDPIIGANSYEDWETQLVERLDSL